MEKRITCKVHDDEERVTSVGVEGEEVQPMLTVWNRIIQGGENFYTLVNGIKAVVKARERTGTKYLTTHPDGVTPNNLDELSEC